MKAFASAKLYILPLAPYQKSNAWKMLLPHLSESRKRRALACRNADDSARIAGAGILLQQALLQEGIPVSDQLFRTSTWGKPFLPGGPYFSLSPSFFEFYKGPFQPIKSDSLYLVSYVVFL